MVLPSEKKGTILRALYYEYWDSVPLRTDQAPCYRVGVLVPVHTSALTGRLLENFTALTFNPPYIKSIHDQSSPSCLCAGIVL